MRQNPNIQKFIAALLLMVFALSMAPKTFFHDLVADHHDGAGCTIEHKATVLHKQVINCHFDDLVVSSPFVLQSDVLTSLANNFYPKKSLAFYTSHSQSFSRHEESRGPPYC